MRKEQIGRNTETVSKNTPADYDVNAVRGEFKELMKRLKNKKSLHSQFSKYDNFYQSAEGLIELGNVRRGKASLGPTKRAVDALKLVISDQVKSQKRLGRQKIQTIND